MEKSMQYSYFIWTFVFRQTLTCTPKKYEARVYLQGQAQRDGFSEVNILFELPCLSLDKDWGFVFQSIVNCWELPNKVRSEGKYAHITLM